MTNPLAAAAGRLRSLPWKKIVLFGVPGLFLFVLVIFVVGYVGTSVPAASDVVTGQTTLVLYADGKTELGRIGSQNRTDVPLAQVPVPVRNAVLSAEDRNYYSEPGISITGIGRAIVANLRGGGVSQGGSTITQQYAKNAFLSQQRTFSRKFRELFIAIKLDRTRSKDEVLEDYLNTIYFGRGAYGIQVAAQTYFGKPVSALSPEEGAVLASSIRSPGLYDPTVNHDRAVARWHYVLDGMAKKGWLPAGQAESATYPKVVPKGAQPNQLGGPNGYLIQQVKDELAAKGFSEAKLTAAGYRVTTTIDKKAQDAAIKAVEGVVNGKGVPDDLREGLVAIEPGTGRIKAEYAGKDYTKIQFNSVTQGSVQPGSSFKPYVLTAALQKGIALNSLFDGRTPQSFGAVKIVNFNNENFPMIDLVKATAESVNTVYYPLGLQAGLDRVASVSKAAGITTPPDPRKDFGSLSLGGFGNGVHPLDQGSGYATFAAGGKHATPYLVEKVETTSGAGEYLAKAKTDVAFPSDVAADATVAMQAVVQDGTATAAQLDGGRPAAGKTGTTSENRSAWFCGFTPQLAAAVVLYRQNNAPLQGILGYDQVTGGSAPAQIWKAFMDAALAGQPNKAFPPAANVGQQLNPPPPPPPPSSSSPPPSPSPSPSSTPALTPTPTLTAIPTPTPTKSVGKPPTTTPPVPTTTAPLTPVASG